MSRAGNAFVCGLIISAGAILCCLSPPDTCSLALASHPRARKTRETWNRKFCCLAASHFSRVQVLSPKSRCRCRCSYFWCSREDYLKSESAHTRIGVLLWPRLELSSRFLVWSHRVDGASFFVFLWSCSAHKKNSRDTLQWIRRRINLVFNTFFSSPARARLRFQFYWFRRCLDCCSWSSSFTRLTIIDDDGARVYTNQHVNRRQLDSGPISI